MRNPFRTRVRVMQRVDQYGCQVWHVQVRHWWWPRWLDCNVHTYKDVAQRAAQVMANPEIIKIS
jgi:hypothetical protein